MREDAVFVPLIRNKMIKKSGRTQLNSYHVTAFYY